MKFAFIKLCAEKNSLSYSSCFFILKDNEIMFVNIASSAIVVEIVVGGSLIYNKVEKMGKKIAREMGE